MLNYARERTLLKSETIEFKQFDNMTLSELIKRFNDLCEDYKKEFSDLEPMVSVYCYGGSEYEVQLNFYENETDEVYNRRVEYVYELLKKKFEHC